jgi:hypoxanthine-DNA glycosylase
MALAAEKRPLQPLEDSITIKRSMAPAGSNDAVLLILGSLPGEASLRAQRYYAHPQNQFWRLLGAAIGEELAAMAYDERLGRLADRGIALWDVVGEARREGSLDGAIRSVTANRLADYVATHPRLKAVAFNGKTASRIGRAALSAIEGLQLIDLPSSSPAYTAPFADKLERWSELGPLACPAEAAKLAIMADDTIEDDEDQALTMVDEALVAGNIANTNGLLVILARLVAKGVFDAEDLHAFSDSYSKPLDHENMRENELISQMQDQMEATLAQLMHYLADKGVQD